MRWKRFMAAAMAATMVMGTAACGAKDESGSKDSESKSTELKSYAEIELGTDYTDLDTTITLFNHRTDLESDEYKGTTWKQYLAEFNKMYPNIKVDLTTDTNYADDALTHLQSGDYETVMMIPQVDKADLETYFISYGDLATMEKEINYADTWEYGGEVYGVPSTATTQGIVYNKKVFEDAGVTELPTTPDEFIAALQKIKDNTDAIPLYTNYAAGWALSGQWDAYIGLPATGDTTYMNQKLAHTKDPFKNYGDDTHAYAVYKILYDAVAEGLTEDDYTTTDWEGSKPMMNNGEIGCMVLGSWALPQMKQAGENADDVGYMPFSITVNGKQYAAASADRGYAVNVNLEDKEKQAAIIFVKWLVERSGYAYNEYSLPVVKGAETQLSFDNVELLQDEPVLEGEEDLLNALNSASEVNINQDGDGVRLQRVIEAAASGSEKYDDIVAEWNQKWSDAQDSEGVEVTE